MESFALFRKHLEFSDIIEQKSPHPFNSRNLIVLAPGGLYLFTVAKLLDEANNFVEYAAIVYRVNFVQTMCIFYINVVWKTSQLFGPVDKLEETIKNRKFHRCEHSKLAITFKTERTCWLCAYWSH